MLKAVLILTLLLGYTGGCEMTGTITNVGSDQPEQAIEAKIKKHAEENFSLDSSQISLKRTDVSNLPEGVRSYYLEKKGSYGNVSYNYLVKSDKIYCSGIEKDFESFLKDSEFLQKKNYSAANFWSLYRTLRFKDRETLVVDEVIVAKPYEFMKPYATQISVPKLEYSDNRVNFIFFTANDGDRTVKRNEVKVNSDYSVKVTSIDLLKS